MKGLVRTKSEVRCHVCPHYKMSEHAHHFGKRSDNSAANRIIFSKRCDNGITVSLPLQTIDCTNLMSNWNARFGHGLFGKRSVEVQSLSAFRPKHRAQAGEFAREIERTRYGAMSAETHDERACFREHMAVLAERAALSSTLSILETGNVNSAAAKDVPHASSSQVGHSPHP